MPQVQPPKPQPMKNTTIFDQAERLKQSGMEAAYQYADLDWKQIASKALRQCAETKAEFTTDDMWEIINNTGVVTSENRAMGSIMQSASRAGMIKATGYFLPSKRVSKHKSPTRVWQSLIYKPKGRVADND